MFFLSQIIRKLNDISIKNKLLIIYLLAVLLPIIIMGSFLIRNMQSMALDGTVREATVNGQRVVKRISEVLRAPIDISNKLYIDQELINLVSKQYTDAFDVSEAYWGFKDFDELREIYNTQISDIRFYAPNETLLDNWHFFKLTDEIQKANWYTNAVSSRNKIVWSYISNSEVSGRNALSLTRQLLEGKTPIGVMVIDVRMDTIESILNQESFETLIINSDGIIISAKDTEALGKSATEMNLNNSELPGTNIQEIIYKKKSYKTITETLTMEGIHGKFTVVSLFPMDKILKPANNAAMSGIMVALVSLLVSLVLIFIFSGALSKRLKILQKEMNGVARGNFDIVSKIGGQDEIGSLARNMDKMVRSIKDLIHEVYEANFQKNQLELKQKEIKLQMLVNQINPHFLFNALETIRMKAICNMQTEIAGVIKMLGNLLRMSLEAGNDEVTLESELSLVKDYLEIQKFRFGDKVSYSINNMVKNHNIKVLSLIIQPLVENSVIHGIEAIIDNGRVTIDVDKREEFIVVSVTDNGFGMDEEQLEKVLESLERSEQKSGRRIGIRNVHQRIKLFYGEVYGLKINSEKGKGTTVEAFLPWRKLEDD